MIRERMTVMTALALLAFAGNSLLCRFALAHTRLDAATFTAVRLAAGAAVPGVLARARHPSPWRSASRCTRTHPGTAKACSTP